MGSLSDVTAAPLMIVVAERRYLMSPLTLADYGTIEQAILAERSTAHDAVAMMAISCEDQASAPPEVSPREMAQWLSSRAGLALTLWLVLRKQHPELTWETCNALVEAEPDRERLEYELDRAGGLPPGNSQGQVCPRTWTRMNLAQHGKTRRLRAGRIGPRLFAA